MTIPKEEADALMNQIAQLKKENEEWQFRHLRDQGDIKILKRERDGKVEEIQECRKKIRDAQAREEKFKEGLASAEESFKATKETIRKLEHSNSILYNRGSQAMTVQGEWRKKYEKKTQELQEAIQKYKELELGEALERQKREEFHSQEKRKDQECIEGYEKSLAQLTEAHEDQKNHLAEQIERLKDDLRQHKLAIEVAQQDEARWKDAFFKMLLVSNEALDELPERLRVAEVELPLHGVPRGIREFMGYCRGLMTAYKNIVKKAKKRF
jgi:DNA repair exonuclease SbcCD ATPase subunit